MRNAISEKDLLTGLQKGDQLLFKYLFDIYYSKLYYYLFKLSADSMLSDDLVQNVMIRIWEKRASLDIKTSLKSYLFRACHNEFLMYLRKQKKEVDLLDTLKWEALSEICIEQKEDYKEANLQKIESVIEQLPVKCKKVFILSRFEQKKT